MADASLQEKFYAAAEFARTSLPSSMDGNDKLKLYKLFKQATEGPCPGGPEARPGFFQVTARAKFDAWKELGDMSKEQAMQEYVDFVGSLKK